jgi:hypothetical protein
MILAEKENACAPEKGIQFKTFDILTMNRHGIQKNTAVLFNNLSS